MSANSTMLWPRDRLPLPKGEGQRRAAGLGLNLDIDYPIAEWRPRSVVTRVCTVA